MDQSRWFIKDRPLQEQIKACKKSLESARRSGRENIVRALDEKLAKLEGLEEVKAKKVKKVTKKVKNVKVEASEQAAVDLLLRAAAKAKAARQAAGEESEEEAAVPEVARSGEEAEVEDDFFDVAKSEAFCCVFKALRVVEVQQSSVGSRRGADALASGSKSVRRWEEGQATSQVGAVGRASTLGTCRFRLSLRSSTVAEASLLGGGTESTSQWSLGADHGATYRVFRRDSAERSSGQAKEASGPAENAAGELFNYIRHMRRYTIYID